MAVVAFVRPQASLVAEAVGVAGCAEFGEAENRLRLYGRAMRLCFIFVLAAWLILQTGCLLSLFLHFQFGIVAGTVDGTIAFKFWPLIDDFNPDHGVSNAFSPHIFPLSVEIFYAIILMIASVPFCASLLYLAKLFSLYSRGEVFTPHNATVMRRIGHSIMATGYSPLLLGPFAHWIGVLRPVTGMTGGMITFVFLGIVLLAISHVMDIGQRIKQDQEDIL